MVAVKKPLRSIASFIEHLLGPENTTVMTVTQSQHSGIDNLCARQRVNEMLLLNTMHLSLERPA